MPPFFIELKRPGGNFLHYFFKKVLTNPYLSAIIDLSKERGKEIMVNTHTWVKVPFLNDGLNVENNRNINNSPKRGYNCAGYALNTFSWYCPNPVDYFPWGDWFDDDWEVESIHNMAVQIMLHDFAFRHIRLIADVAELHENEYAFAFRLSDDGDFHYVKRGRNGTWYHKMGNSPDINIMPREEVFSASWCYRYRGPIALFAIEY